MANNVIHWTRAPNAWCIKTVVYWVLKIQHDQESFQSIQKVLLRLNKWEALRFRSELCGVRWGRVFQQFWFSLVQLPLHSKEEHCEHCQVFSLVWRERLWVVSRRCVSEKEYSMFAPQLHGIALLHRRFQKYDQVLHSIFLWCQHNKFKLNLGRSWRKHLRFSEAILQKDLVFRFRPWINLLIRYSWYQAHFANLRPGAALHSSYSRTKQNH